MPGFMQSRWPLLIGWLAGLSAVTILMYSYMFDAKKEPEGFRGIQWGSSIRAYPDLTFLAQDGDLKFYSRETDQLKLDDIDVERIVYGFYKDRFYNAAIYYSSRPTLSRVLNVLSTRYGTPYQPEGSTDKYFWSLNMVDVLLTFDESSNEGRVSYLFQPIQNEMEQNEKSSEGEKS